ncbi:histidine phosphatase family protein [Candidatus Amoebophilus asiaticus]|nr:histidine phosphatase family protein [Candidatus Amoebophilus asiaticus]
MSKILILCRHAKSNKANGISDFDRTLNGRGKADAQFMGNLLLQLDIMPNRILASPAVRAETTASILANEMAFSDQIQSERCIYDQELDEVLDKIKSIDNDHNIAMVVGHNPGMEQLARLLLGMRSFIVIPTCGIVVLEFNINEWREIDSSASILKFFFSPKLFT